jgi:tetratricopeptide (TPR) repeat protein
VSEASCPRCGVVFAKIAVPRLRPPVPAPPVPRAAPAPAARPAAASNWGSRAVTALLLAVMGACGFFAVRRVLEAPAAATPRPQVALVPTRPPNPRLPPPPTRPPAGPSTVQSGPTPGIPDADHDAAFALSNKINARQPLGLQDLRTAEDLHARYAAEPRLRTLLSASLMTLADQERTQRRFPEAAAYARRAASLDEQDSGPRVALMNLLLEGSDWTAAEAAARDALRLLPRDRVVLEGLAYSLFRQDRNREAAEYYRTVIELGGSATARDILDRIQKNLADERGMTEQRLSHFHVRYDGGDHDDVGREILRALERHYATLTSTFDHQIAEPVPVILFSQEDYYNAAGAPAWSGGVFDHSDGRIRVPIRGLTSALTPDMDDTLLHELTHAFINDRSRGLAPREVHEGMAQYMEGKRVSSELSEEQLRGLADGRIGGVGGFYLRALAFAEYLVALRGQGGINDVLKSMAESGNLDEAFRQVYGQDYRGTQQAWWNHFRQQYGS